MTRVLALDPGSKVGYARADISPSGEWTDFRHGISDLWDMAEAVHGALYSQPWYSGIEEQMVSHDPEYDTVVMEDWRLYKTHAQTMIGSTFPSVQFIGAVKLCCRLAGVPCIMQGAALKSTADKTMKHLNPELYELVSRPVRHDDGHDQDAIRHMWHWTFCNTAIAKEHSETHH
jgi:hypothetical protein